MTKFGQHFLVDKKVLRTMVDIVAEYGSHETILEIGPGRGVLTKELVKMADRVIAIEIDQAFKPDLDSLQTKYKNLTVRYSDILKVDLMALGLTDGNYSLASNLPYEITGIVLRKFLTTQPYPKHMGLLIQYEVAERIVAKPGDLSILGLSVQALSQPRFITRVKPDSFRPRPQVDSAIISLENIRQHALPNESGFFRLIKAGFAQKRKLLRANLVNIKIPKEAIISAFQELSLTETARAQELSLEQWLVLVDRLDKFIV
ncbi:MAG: 16S rRNA (adenine(1518)-N(6)/adenine(1519)-N(6))-dimethyltransferase RsmA [Patescibacteria group bacterium]